MAELEHELYTADRMLAELHAKAAISNFYQKQNAETQKSGDDQKQAIKVK